MSRIGEISLGSHPDGVELSREESGDGPIAFTMIIPNEAGLPAPTNYTNGRHMDGYGLLLAAGVLLAMLALFPVLRRRRKREEITASMFASSLRPLTIPATAAAAEINPDPSIADGSSGNEGGPKAESARKGAKQGRCVQTGPPL